ASSAMRVLSLTEIRARLTGTWSRCSYRLGSWLWTAMGGLLRGWSAGEREAPVGDLAHGLDEQRALDLLDPLVQFGFGLARADVDTGLAQRGPGVDALVDNVHAHASLGGAGGDRVAHGVRPGVEREQRGVGVDEARRERAHEVRRENPHEPGAH